MIKVSKPQTRQDYLTMFHEVNDIKHIYGDEEEHIKYVGSKLLEALKKRRLNIHRSICQSSILL